MGFRKELLSYICSLQDQCYLMQMRNKRSHERMRQDLDENMDDQEVELLDDNTQSRTSSDEVRYLHY